MGTQASSLIDCHLHLQDDRFAADLPEVLARARSTGVDMFVCNGSCQSDWPEVLTLARSDRSIIPCFGLHPWYAGTRSLFWLAELKHYLQAIPSAIGETGLDRWQEDRDEAAQETVFRAQLSLAAELGRPITIHCVKAWGWMMDVLASQRPLPNRMLFHSYSGSAELIKPLAEMGAYFSYAGSLLREKAIHRRQALAATPLNRLLIETDAPDIIPPRRFCITGIQSSSDGKPRNEPTNLAGIVRGAAELLGLRYDELCSRLNENCRSLFGDIIPRQI